MLELVRLDLTCPAAPQEWADPAMRGLALGVACTAQELEEIQRLRYRVFTEDMGVMFPGDGIDQDYFDDWCEHIMVRDMVTDQVVGTYRLLTPEKARAAGGYYSETEFDLTALLDELGEDLVEIGRSCTHPDYRNGVVIMLLWSGVAEFIRRGGYDHVLGCASVSLRDGGGAAAEVWRTVSAHLNDTSLPQVTPRQGYPLKKLDETVLPARLPPLIKGYLNIGAKACGEPAWDPDFNSADFPLLMEMNRMDDRYRRRLGLPEVSPDVPK